MNNREREMFRECLRMEHLGEVTCTQTNRIFRVTHICVAGLESGEESRKMRRKER